LADNKVIEIVEKAFSESEKMAPEDLQFSYKGILLLATLTSPETLEALKSFEARSDDVILIGYPKTGECCLLDKESIHSAAIQKCVPSFNTAVIPEEMVIHSYVTYWELSVLPSHQIPIKSCVFFCQILVLVRNTKDTAVSYYHFSNNLPMLPSFTSWDEFFTAFLNGRLGCGSYFDHLVEWNKYIDNEKIMVISYEELKQMGCLTVGMKKIAAFFEFSLSEEDFAKIVKKTSFQAMKENSKETHSKIGDMLFWRGVVGNWRDCFAKAQNEEMDRKFHDCLRATKLAARMKYDVYCKT
uniref:Sulfotransferase n=1 Tax=Dromaius novaehollandiae TaxID=8790 RepID=A0A8C4PBN0_DRONO